MRGRGVLVAWSAAHIRRAFHDGAQAEGLEVFPLNQKAWQAASEQGARICLEPWRLAGPALIEAASNHAWQALSRWRETVFECADGEGVDPAQLYHMDAARLWMAYRELHYCRLLLEEGLPRIPLERKLVVPSASPRLFDRWYGENDIPAHALAGLAITQPMERMDVPHGSGPLTLACVLPEPADGQRWHWVDLFGLSDPLHHIKRARARGGLVRLGFESELSGHIPSYRAMAERDPEIQLFEYPTAVEGASRARVQARHADPLAEAAVRELWPRHRAMRAAIHALVDRDGPPASIIASNHVSPAGLVALETAAMHGMPGELVSHGGTALHPPFLMLPPPRANWRNRVGTGNEKQFVDGMKGDAPWRTEVMPSPRFRIGPKRIARFIHRNVRRSDGVIRVGIAVTTGEASHAPDTSVLRVLAQVATLSRPPGSLRHHVQLSVRLREFEDSDLLFQSVIREAGGEARVYHGKVADRQAFFENQDVIVEVGVPGTVTLEAIAAGVPCFRMPGQKGGTQPILHVPELDDTEPWQGGLGSICNNGWARRRLALKQFLSLAIATREHA